MVVGVASASAATGVRAREMLPWVVTGASVPAGARVVAGIALTAVDVAETLVPFGAVALGAVAFGAVAGAETTGGVTTGGMTTDGMTTDGMTTAGVTAAGVTTVEIAPTLEGPGTADEGAIERGATEAEPPAARATAGVTPGTEGSARAAGAGGGGSAETVDRDVAGRRAGLESWTGATDEIVRAGSLVMFEPAPAAPLVVIPVRASAATTMMDTNGATAIATRLM